MKKTYVKPELVVESFQLNAAVAASCSSEGGEAINYSETQCEHDGGYFALDACEIPVTGADQKYDNNSSDEFCYHGPMIFIYS